ncbi:hypothetical protein NQ315_000390 [Exocentrus adspersus]|uniref:Uncharacterized protein n=1 Tax=Exocentrus adspersus TaxID=1586481 RepID=A0AAV8VLI7_9CUCU|nr:hypothetical protein NQ315_000390 [Exocentrus adspersus]
MPPTKRLNCRSLLCRSVHEGAVIITIQNQENQQMPAPLCEICKLAHGLLDKWRGYPYHRPDDGALRATYSFETCIHGTSRNN